MYWHQNLTLVAVSEVIFWPLITASGPSLRVSEGPLNIIMPFADAEVSIAEMTFHVIISRTSPESAQQYSYVLQDGAVAEVLNLCITFELLDSSADSCG